MPRNSARARVINQLGDILEHAVKMGTLHFLYGLPTRDIDELIFVCYRARKDVLSRRYLFRRKYRKRTPRFHIYLDTDHDDAMTDEEFRFNFRVSRVHFWELVVLLKDHAAFQRKSSDSRGPLPKEAAHQLLILMKYYGCEGSQSSSLSLAGFFGVGKGIIDICRKNALEALLSLEDRTYFWPDASERRLIASRIQEAYFFPNCVGLIDGTLLPLAFRPILHGENYLSRKRFYAIVMLVICDDNSRILYYHLGWPGSVHDNRVWRNCKINRRPLQHFSGKQYLLGDSAFTASSIMIPPFKTTTGGTLSRNKSAFNTLLSKPRVKSEHCIGILKGRFPFLRGIRMRIANKEDLQTIINHVRGTVVLHNFLRNDESWLEAIPEGDDDLDPEATATGNQADYSRRDELFYYLSELPETTIN